MSILYLINDAESKAAQRARTLIARAKREIGDDALRSDLIELMEAVILSKLPELSRQEIEAMLQLNDIRKSRVYQEAKEEGELEGIEKGRKLESERQIEVKIRSISKLAAHSIPAESIADILGLDIDVVRRHLANGQANGASHG